MGCARSEYVEVTYMHNMLALVEGLKIKYIELESALMSEMSNPWYGYVLTAVTAYPFREINSYF